MCVCVLPVRIITRATDPNLGLGEVSDLSDLNPVLANHTPDILMRRGIGKCHFVLFVVNIS